MAEEVEDYDLPGNGLDPRAETPEQSRKLPLAVRAYGGLCLATGIVSVPLLAIYYWYVLSAAFEKNGGRLVGTDPTLAMIVGCIGSVLALLGSIGLVYLGISLLRNRRRHAALRAYGLIFISVGQILCDIMLDGFGVALIRPLIQLGILIALSARVDPSLRQERELERRLEDLQDRAAAEEGMLGRDLTGAGYIKLNFFNLFWVFMIASMAGLVLEVIWHMTVVDPGVYQDRAGLLFGPFSPIYGFGAVLLTCALNRFYKKNAVVIFLVSAVIGGAFEYAVSWFMQMSFGAVAWDYTGATILGVPDPVAALCGGRTSTFFACIWGTLGLCWIKLVLPRLLELINLMPWKWRYSLTTVMSALMVLNGALTLGALDCWFQRESGIEATSPVEEWFNATFDDAYMEHRFQSMTIHPDDSSRVSS